ncbi:uncharacterized protein BX664DRAFT_191369 [Halteromyces radiatus]|uniref:uncharacterized protein n=1 Tax=Halteromyces radiatus TaxID=101107 RepID=UPI0022207D2D|nr:uncharacterized protein BX664DRAFT_191369 [Halteromyces radiatus]KAI8081295.1 hypothetical protein BX664DRAFT_191369 [Halteromyces radiatus]
MDIKQRNDSTLTKNIKGKVSTPDTKAHSILTDALFPERKPSTDNNAIDNGEDEETMKQNDPLSAQVWRLYTKAKDTLPNGARLENLTWRMMAMTLNKKQQKPTDTPSDDSNMIDSFVDYSSSQPDDSFVVPSNQYKYTPPTSLSNNSITIPADTTHQISSPVQYPSSLKNIVSKQQVSSAAPLHAGAMSFEDLLTMYYAKQDQESDNNNGSSQSHLEKANAGSFTSSGNSTTQFSHSSLGKSDFFFYIL